MTPATPDSDELVKRLRTVLIKNGVIQPTEQEQKEAGPPTPNPMQQLELARASANVRKDVANAQIAESKAHAGDLETQRIIQETAGKHLDNLAVAQKLGMPQLAARSEAEAAASLNPVVPPAPGTPVLPNQ